MSCNANCRASMAISHLEALCSGSSVLMALTTRATGNTIAAAFFNDFKDHLEGAASATLAWFLRCTATDDFLIRLGDAAGVREVQIQDSAGVSVASIDSDGNVSFAGTLAVTGAVTLTVPLAVAQGGTGLSTFTAAGALPYSTGATALAALAAGTARQGLIITAGATAPSWAASLRRARTSSSWTSTPTPRRRARSSPSTRPTRISSPATPA